MERKEHPVPVIGGGADTLEFQDEDENPFKPENPVNFKLIEGECGMLREDTLDVVNYTISLSDVSTRTFRVVVDDHVVPESDRFQNLDEERTDETDEKSKTKSLRETKREGETMAEGSDYREDDDLEGERGDESK